MAKLDVLHSVIVSFHGLLVLVAVLSVVPMVYMILTGKKEAKARRKLFLLLLPTPLVQVLLGLTTMAHILLEFMAEKDKKSVKRGLVALNIIEANLRTILLALYYYMLVFITWSIYSIHNALGSLSDRVSWTIFITLRSASIGLGVIVLPIVAALNVMNGVMDKSKYAVKMVTMAMAYTSAVIAVAFVLVVIAIMLGLTVYAWKVVPKTSRKHLKKISVLVPIVVVVSLVFALGVGIFTSVVNMKDPVKTYVSFFGFALLVISDLVFVFILLLVYGPAKALGRKIVETVNTEIEAHKENVKKQQEIKQKKLKEKERQQITTFLKYIASEDLQERTVQATDSFCKWIQSKREQTLGKPTTTSFIVQIVDETTLESVPVTITVTQV